MQFFNTLFAKLTAAFLAVVLLFGAAILYISQSMSEMYNQEVMQRLNQSVAMYVADQQPLLSGGRVNEQAMDELAARAMILNPSLEIYLLDNQGNILSHRLPDGTVQTSSVSSQAIEEFMAPDSHMPVLGTDPRNPNNANIFSAAPIQIDGETLGYVYAIIGGDIYQSLRDSVMSSYVMQISSMLILSATLIAAMIGGALFFYLTRRITHLRSNVTNYGQGKLDETLTLTSDVSSGAMRRKKGDDITELDESFQLMATQIDQHLESLEAMDKTRRDLIANVSHDLRTPLASMQGYIETLIIKNGSLSDDDRRRHLETAHKHSQRLADLVNELFELAKLESNAIEPKIERFSLLELVHDSVQEFGLSAQNHHISLEVDASEDCFVAADIALIHRVLQNLLDNAIHHTPKGGTVCVRVNRTAENALVEVSDTGKGIQTHEIPFIFDRFYQCQQQEPSDKIGTGLGLAIVKRILDLHKSPIDVRSQVDEGTSFIFELPRQAQAA